MGAVVIRVVSLIKPTEIVILIQKSLFYLYFLSVGVGGGFGKVSSHVKDTGYSDFLSSYRPMKVWMLPPLSYTFFLSYYSLTFLPQTRLKTIAYTLKNTSVIYVRLIQIIVQIKHEFRFGGFVLPLTENLPVYCSG